MTAKKDDGLVLFCAICGVILVPLTALGIGLMFFSVKVAFGMCLVGIPVGGIGGMLLGDKVQ